MQTNNSVSDVAAALTADDVGDDLLKGTQEIAAFLGMSHRAAYNLVEKGAIPIKRLPGVATIYSRKSALRALFDLAA